MSVIEAPPAADTSDVPGEDPSENPAKSQNSGSTWQRFIIATIALAGVLVFLYPATASWLSAVKERNSIASYGETMDKFTPEQLAAELAKAEQYNSSDASGLIVDPFSNTSSGGMPKLDSEAKEYLSQLSLDPGGVMSRVRIPSINVDLPIRHGATEEVLRKGAGHLYGSSLPVGGAGTHSVITAHSGLPESTLFDNLPKVKKGDIFTISTYGRVMTYRVNSIETVVPTDIDKLQNVPGKDLVTLITCTPVPVNSHRLLVTGERIDTPAEVSEQATEDAPFPLPWAPILVGLAFLGWLWILILAILSRRKRGRGRHRSRRGAPSRPVAS
ncbi:class C sortase [Haematomicrobium sanguinis]|uniref:class C sortase n=1 Tax=Haematomicrobium sanguinis TaxID=479106 RepID=UPI000A7A0031|nr:class C sortase [Haematomicrobium sanguinis]